MIKAVNWLLFVAVVIIALAFRVVQLDRKVLHNDEANQMKRAGLLQEEGVYEYDPVEHHGPTLYYLSMPIAYLTSGKDFTRTTETTFKLVPALFGTGIVLLLLLLRPALGWGATLCAALFTAISTCMVYYSRFYIQETLLVFFTLGAFACGWRYFRNSTAPWAVATGIFVGLMHATKETCIIAYAAMGVAFILSVFWQRGKVEFRKVDFIVLPVHTLYMVLSALIVSMVLFSSFFTNIGGIWDSVATYSVYFGRGSGAATAHVHPFYYYLRILIFYKEGGLVWSEASIIVLGLLGLVMVLLRSRSLYGMDLGFCRFILLYTLIMTLVYSAISYKTPWCMMSFLHGWIILAGIGGAGIWRSVRHMAFRGICCVIILALAFSLAKQTRKASFRFGADYRNPYAYAHTLTSYLSLVQRIRDISEVSHEGKGMFVASVTNPQDAWPLPWYLRDFTRAGYWYGVDTLPEGVRPAVVVSSLDLSDSIQGLVGKGYQREFWGLRPEVPIVLYIRSDLWDKFMEKRTRASR